MRIASLAAALVVVASPAFAHVGVTPRESKVGTTETYTFRVPSEGGMTTSAIVLDVPDGVTVISVADAKGVKHEEKKVGDRVVQVTWTVSIKAGAFAEFSLVARNPAQGEEILWTVHQKYSDGMSSDWVGAAGTKAPAPVTKLAPAGK